MAALRVTGRSPGAGRTRATTLRPSSEGLVEASGQEPFFLFLSPPAGGAVHTALIVRAPAVLPSARVRSVLTRTIAASVRRASPFGEPAPLQRVAYHLGPAAETQLGADA
jgi:hypothetical protein